MTESHPEVPAPRTLVVIPLYNHSQTVRGVAEKALAAGFPVLVVDDGSTDAGLEVVKDLPVQRHHLAVNAGKGSAILAAAAVAAEQGFEAILTIDADGQHDPADARLLVEAAAADWPSLVIGARRMDKEDNVPASSLFGRDFSNFWVRLECGQTLPDTQSGYRLYPVDFLVGGRFFSRRYTFEIEVLVRAAWAGLPISSVSVSVYYPPGEERISHFDKFRDNVRLTCLHTCLVTRSLLPWPQRRLYRKSTGTELRPSILRPVAFFKAISKEHSSPAQLAAAAWIGIFLGALPIIPFGIAAIVYTAHKIHLNKVAAVGASNLCIAPFVPLLCVEVGHLLLYGAPLEDFSKQTLLYELHHRLLEWLIGSLLIGPLLGALGAALTYLVVNWFRKRKSGNR
ncbi:DUF2062 domain-containing protein [Geomonas sp. RF6]|uniref:DUF2062 domain-containing protein n=1 Tax=Geomonas sp. RF6 TaxID=2897342 RepID=UPI001E314430|nr:DUF2062 domain-containing protein [Geomonas sp. RF6]UFS69377.1 DUF2062 domain-containing protein [Geomonas sp. RF6]